MRKSIAGKNRYRILTKADARDLAEKKHYWMAALMDEMPIQSTQAAYTVLVDDDATPTKLVALPCRADDRLPLPHTDWRRASSALLQRILDFRRQ